MLTKKNYFTRINILNLLIVLIPVSMAIGNLVINVIVVLICIVGLLTYGLKIFKLDHKIIQYLIYSFFSYLILITIIRNFPNLSDARYYEYADILSFFFSHNWEYILKSFLFLIFLILFLVLNYLIKEKKFYIKFFFISAASMTLLVSFTEVLNYISEKNMLIFFSNEKIAGGYIQRFSLFFLSALAILSFNSSSYKKVYFFIFLFFILFFIIAIGVSQNRMPLLIYFCSVSFFFILIQKNKKKLKTALLVSFFICSVFFVSLIKFFPGCAYSKDCEGLNNKHIVVLMNSFVGNVTEILTVAPELFYFGSLDRPINFASGYLITFNSGVQTWKKNKLFGGGLKSFRVNCTQYHKNYTGTNYQFQVCNTHPHNYIIEMLVDTGIVGMSIFYSIFIVIIFNFYKEWRKFNYKNYSTSFFVIMCFELFPIRSSGSFFSTGNAILIFFLLAILINISKIESLTFKDRLKN